MNSFNQQKSNGRRIMRLPKVCSRVGCSPSGVYKKMEEGLFPKNFKIFPGGRASGWYEDEIDAWIENHCNDEGSNKTLLNEFFEQNNIPAPDKPILQGVFTRWGKNKKYSATLLDKDTLFFHDLTTDIGQTHFLEIKIKGGKNNA